VTIGKESFKVPDPFLVLATQNPIETEGTYALLKPRSTGSCSRSWSAIRRRPRSS
jgi:hypothetical protein